jgi:exodeoxyribonuclease-3
MGKLKIISWNVNGIRAIHKKGALQWFIKEQPDILCMQEIKALEEQVPNELHDLDGYYKYYSSAERKGYSGVATFSKIKPARVMTGIDIPKFDSEGRILLLEFPKFLLFNVYFPNGKASEERLQYKMDFYEAFLDYCDNLKSLGKNLFFCGDVNTAHKEIDLARPKENKDVSGFLPIEREWLDKVQEHGYLDTFRMFNSEPDNYTWWDYVTRARERNVGWRIDYFFVNEYFKNNVKSAFICSEIMGSDHCPIGIDIEV